MPMSTRTTPTTAGPGAVPATVPGAPGAGTTVRRGRRGWIGRRSRGLLAVLVTTAVLAGCGGSDAPPPDGPDPLRWPELTLTPLHADAPNPDVIAGAGAVGPDGRLWYVNLNGNRLLRLAPTGEEDVVVFDPPFPVSTRWVSDVTAGPDGAMWCTTYGPFIARFTPDGESRFFPVPRRRGDTVTPYRIATGADGQLYFLASGVVGRMTVQGRVTMVDAPGLTLSSTLVAAPDGAVWYTLPATPEGPSQVGRLAPDGHRTFPAPNLAAGHSPVTVDHAGNLWYAQQGVGAIARVDPRGERTVHEIPGFHSISGILFAPDRTIWFSGITPTSRPVIGRYTPGAGSTAYRLPPEVSVGPPLLVVGPDQRIWLGAGGGIYRIEGEGVTVPTPTVAVPPTR
jgi:Streptogramin lyase